MPDEPKPELIPCPDCDGCGKVDNRDKKSWRRFSGMSNDHPDMKHIMGATGVLVPIICPTCKGLRLVEAAGAPDKKAVIPAAPYIPAINPDALGHLMAAARGEYGAYVTRPEVVPAQDGERHE